VSSSSTFFAFFVGKRVFLRRNFIGKLCFGFKIFGAKIL
jgi:hypothetical protein